MTVAISRRWAVECWVVFPGRRRGEPWLIGSELGDPPHTYATREDARESAKAWRDRCLPRREPVERWCARPVKVDVWVETVG